MLCNCDNPNHSNFWKYFKSSFNELELKKLISTHYAAEGNSYKLEYDGKDTLKTHLHGNGDFRSDECIEILNEADIVCTNPPFSLFREYIAQLINNNKKFLVIGNMNAITYKDIFSLIKNNQIWLGYHSVKEFLKPDGSIQKFGNICWYTNIEHGKRNEKIILNKNYSSKEYPKYDDYNAIEVNRVVNIPINYNGVMGVPITFLNSYNPKQFKIIGIDRYVSDNPHYGKRFTINGTETYARILIKKNKEGES